MSSRTGGGNSTRLRVSISFDEVSDPSPHGHVQLRTVRDARPVVLRPCVSQFLVGEGQKVEVNQSARVVRTNGQVAHSAHRSPKGRYVGAGVLKPLGSEAPDCFLTFLRRYLQLLESAIAERGQLEMTRVGAGPGEHADVGTTIDAPLEQPDCPTNAFGPARQLQGAPGDNEGR